jgi:hypothetical protein
MLGQSETTLVPGVVTLTVALPSPGLSDGPLIEASEFRNSA